MHSVVKTWLALGLAFFLTGCGQESVQSKPEIHITGSTMGTYYSIKVADAAVTDAAVTDAAVTDAAVTDAAKLQAEVDVLLERVNDQMSTYRPDSELSRFNQHKGSTPLVVSRDTARVVTEAIHIGRESRGALDVTVGPLVNLWGFGPDAKPTKVPSDELITQTRQKTGLGNLHVVTSVDADTLQKDIPDLYVDLSAIAKGFGVDKVAEYLESLGARNYLVEIGGELRINGVNGKGHPWRVAIEKPTANAGSVQEVIVPGDNGVATSGDYRNYYELDGKRGVIEQIEQYLIDLRRRARDGGQLTELLQHLSLVLEVVASNQQGTADAVVKVNLLAHGTIQAGEILQTDHQLSDLPKAIIGVGKQLLQILGQ